MFGLINNTIEKQVKVREELVKRTIEREIDKAKKELEQQFEDRIKEEVEYLHNRIEELEENIERMKSTTKGAFDIVYEKLSADIQEVKDDMKYTEKQISYIKAIMKHCPNAPEFKGETKEEAKIYLNKWDPIYKEYKKNNRIY
jgi:hypothetical protein